MTRLRPFFIIKRIWKTDGDVTRFSWWCLCGTYLDISHKLEILGRIGTLVPAGGSLDILFSILIHTTTNPKGLGYIDRAFRFWKTLQHRYTLFSQLLQYVWSTWYMVMVILPQVNIISQIGFLYTKGDNNTHVANMGQGRRSDRSDGWDDKWDGDGKFWLIWWFSQWLMIMGGDGRWIVHKNCL